MCWWRPERNDGPSEKRSCISILIRVWLIRRRFAAETGIDDPGFRISLRASTTNMLVSFYGQDSSLPWYGLEATVKSALFQCLRVRPGPPHIRILPACSPSSIHRAWLQGQFPPTILAIGEQNSRDFTVVDKRCRIGQLLGLHRRLPPAGGMFSNVANGVRRQDLESKILKLHAAYRAAEKIPRLQGRGWPSMPCRLGTICIRRGRYQFRARQYSRVTSPTNFCF